MQLITAIIQPFMLDRLTRRLRKEKVPGYTVTPVSGSWSEAEENPQPTMARMKVEVAVNDEQVDKICELICSTVSTLQEGDGILMVTPINKVVNLRTGERVLELFETRRNGSGRNTRSPQAPVIDNEGFESYAKATRSNVAIVEGRTRAFADSACKSEKSQSQCNRWFSAR